MAEIDGVREIASGRCSGSNRWVAFWRPHLAALTEVRKLKHGGNGSGRGEGYEGCEFPYSETRTVGTWISGRTVFQREFNHPLREASAVGESLFPLSPGAHSAAPAQGREGIDRSGPPILATSGHYLFPCMRLWTLTPTSMSPVSVPIRSCPFARGFKTRWLSKAAILQRESALRTPRYLPCSFYLPKGLS